MYTSFTLWPAEKAKWTPEESFVFRLAGHLGCCEVWHVTGYARALKWYADGKDREVFSEGLVGIDRVMQLWQSGKAKCVLTNLRSPQWSQKVYESLKELAESATYEHYSPCDPWLTIGPHSIPSRELEKAIARRRFSLSLSGDGMPRDPDAYFRVVSKNEHIVSLLRFLEHAAGFPWKMTMSMSY